MERFGFFTKKDIESFFKILKKQSKIEVSKDFICFDASIFKYLEVDIDLRKYFKINYNNKLYDVNEKNRQAKLIGETYLNAFAKNPKEMTEQERIDLYNRDPVLFKQLFSK